MTVTDKLKKTIMDGLIREKHLKLHLDALVDQSNNLSLILEHAEEYYKNTRLYKFTKNGFISYELFNIHEGKALYFADIFIKKSARGSKALSRLIDVCVELAHNNKVDIAYCKVEKTNKHIKSLQAVYARMGFEKLSESDEALYYKWVRP